MQLRISILTAYQDFPFYAIPYGTCDLASRLALKITNAPVVGVTFSIFLLFIVFVYFEVEHDYFWWSVVIATIGSSLNSWNEMGKKLCAT